MGNRQWEQTAADKTEAVLRAAPQYFNQHAFETLANSALYPHTLPYSAGFDELRAALQQSGVPLWQLRQALLPLNNPPVRQAEVAAERFAVAHRQPGHRHHPERRQILSQ